MDARTYIKQNGWDKAKQHLEIMDAENWHNHFYDDLKTLVDAYELVQSWGGVNDAKVAVSFSSHKEYLKKAIKLVESVDEIG